MDWRAHSEKQAQALFSAHPITIVATGIQWGKTTVGALWLKTLMHRYTSPEDNFIITSPTYPILAQSTLPPFLRYMEGCGKLDKKDNAFRMTGGGTCWIRTGTHPDSIVGIPKVRGILCDEAGKYGLYFWENIQGRADSCAAPIMLVTSPYSLNWLYKEFIRPRQKDPNARPDALIIQARSVENPYFNTARYYEREKTMDPRRFKMMYGGAWDKMEGLVYDCFDEDENQCDQAPPLTGARIVGGIDWGWTEPFVFKVRAITPDGRHWGILEFYRSGLTIPDIADALCRIVVPYGVTQIYAGPDQPASIEELNRRFRSQGIKCSVLAANNDVRSGIERHYELLKTRRLKYVRGANPYTVDELNTYHYPEPKDLKPDQDVKDGHPVQQNDHALDADRYISIMTYAGAERRLVARVPEEQPPPTDPVQRLERLRRPGRRLTGTENWS